MLNIRMLNENDDKQVEYLDSLSGFNVLDWLDCEESFGIFDNNKLIGYCTLGYADDCCDAITQHETWTIDSRLLSDVYVLREHRNKGIGQVLINTIMKKVEDETIFLTLLYPDLYKYYEKLGFICLDEEKYAMIKIKNKNIKINNKGENN